MQQRDALRLAEASDADICWLLMAKTLTAGVRLELGGLVVAGGRGRRRFVAGPEAVAAAAATLSPPGAPPAYDDAMARLDAVQLAVLAAVPSPLRPPDAEQRPVWWVQTGRHLRSTVDGATLLRRGHRPGPYFAAALRAALVTARAGGDPAAQLAAAERCLSRAGS